MTAANRVNGGMKIGSGLLAALFVIAALATPASAISIREVSNIHGRFAAGFYSVDDDADAGDVSAFAVYYRVIGDSVAGWENISYNIDGRLRAASDDYNDEAPTNRLLLANVEIKRLLWNHLDLTVGRSFIQEFVSQNVDGINARFRLTKSFGVGGFGGFRPDPYEDSFNTDYTTAGAYIFAVTEFMNLSGGYAIDTYQGLRDRERANAAFSFMPATQWFHFNASIDMDNDFDVHEGEGGPEGWGFTNILIDGNFRPNPSIVFNFTYNMFRAINREASFEHIVGEEFLSEESYTTLRGALDYRPWKRLALYGGADLRSRDIDGESAGRVYVGFRSDNFYGGTRWDLRGSYMNWFTSEIMAVRGSLGGSWNRIDLDATVIWQNSTQDELENEMNQMIYEFSANWWATKKIYVTGLFAYSSEEYLDIEEVYSARYADNFVTTTLMLQAGYRF